MPRFLSLWSIACLVSISAIQSNVTASQLDHDRNWPQWRGPTGNGLVAHGNPPVEWSEDKNIKWKVKIPGKGHATPAIWDDKIFVLSAVPTGKQVEAPAPRPSDNAGQRRRGRGGRGGRGGPPTQEYAFTILCLDRGTGKVVWEKVGRREVPHAGVQRSNSYSSGSPVTDGELVFASYGSSGLYCYDFNGDLMWDKDLGKVSVTFGEASSPALHGDSLIVVQDNNGESFVYAFDKKTGNEIWKKPRNERSGWTTPSFIERDGKTQVLITGSNAVRGYDLESGELLWQCSGLGSNPVPMLVADETSVYAMSGHREGAAIAINLGGTGDLTDRGGVRWTITRGTPYVPSPLLYDGLLYFVQRNDALLSCVDPQTGDAHYSQQRVEGIDGIYASPIGVNNRIYLPSQNGTTVVFEKSNELNIIATNRLDDGFDASPAVAGDELFLRGRENLYCIAAQ